jgi:single-stranded-DNA-specific exonuclease
MKDYEGFKRSLAEAAERFKQLDRKETVRIISHLDADGVSACAIFVKMLNMDSRKYSISIIPQLNEKIIKELTSESYSYYVFTDLGSSQIDKIKEHLSGKTVFILDHHDVQHKKIEGIVHVNPHLFEIDGCKEISGAGVVYLFCKSIKPSLNMAHIAIVGAVGDVQEDIGFLKLNNEILQEAVASKKISVTTGIRFFGAETRPLHKILEYSTDPYIPGVSGSESSAIQFLQQVGINPQASRGWKRLGDLTKDEQKKLVAAIIMKRVNEENPEDILGNIYTLPDEPEGVPTRDAREFATLLNACGRMNKASLGIGTCLGDKKIRERAFDKLKDYKKEIMNAMRWYGENKDSAGIIKKKGFILINAENKIMPSMIGTVASMLSKSNDIKKGTYIMSMAQNEDNTTKVSLRIAGLGCCGRNSVDLLGIVKRITKEVGGEAGGHQFAAGALIQTALEDKFIEAAIRVLEQMGMEELI